jgi:isopenicillin N synthase-like dioxygenase
MAGILGVDKAEFLSLFDSPLTNMTLLHYPPQSPDTSGFGIHPHTRTRMRSLFWRQTLSVA